MGEAGLGDVAGSRRQDTGGFRTMDLEGHVFIVRRGRGGAGADRDDSKIDPI